MPGELVGNRYRVIEQLGSGGMGRVVSAIDERDGTQVAVKLLVAPAWRSVLIERFFREARTVSRIDSPHVVKITAVSGTTDATPFMVMERLNGRDYARRVADEGALPLREVADCIVQACAALAATHALGVIHRDVKPSNLFDHRNSDGSHTVKVLDFGISKARGAQECEWTLTTTRDAMLGSPPYMSPEHLRDARNVDQRTDIWSLGVVAYQLLTGHLPFNGSSVGSLLCAVLERRFTPLAEVKPDLPAAVLAIVERCLSSEPTDRYFSAADLAREFAPFASPAVARSVEKMTTEVASTITASKPLPARGLPHNVLQARLDGEHHTMTLPPVLPVSPVPLSARGADSASSAPIASIATMGTVAASAPVHAEPTLSSVAPAPAVEREPSQPLSVAHPEFGDDASHAITTLMDGRPSMDSVPPIDSSSGITLLKKKTRASRIRNLAAAACASLALLLALPFAFSGPSPSGNITPATATAPAFGAAPLATVTHATLEVVDDEVTFEAAPAADARPATSASAAKTVASTDRGRAAGTPKRAPGKLPRNVERAIDSRR